MLGETISHYLITEKLGQGGMGEVYLAEDTRLKRRVALKFLAPELARDRESLARFRNEARAAAELSHPNIATIHDFDEVEGKSFLVLEFLEGRTLRDRIAQGPLPIDEALRIGQAIAQGLTEAHVHGIVHRDIKSANVMLTERGEVKILDFGLAHREGATQITRPGSTLGTVGYMSPEQARGESADEKSDVWGLGIVLFEMTTGRLPFRGEDTPAVIHAILERDPEPITGLRTGVPLELERIIGKALARSPAERYQHADDLLADLRVLQRQTGEQPTATMVTGAVLKRSPRRWPWVTGSLIAVVLLIAFGLQRTMAPTENESLDLPRLAVLPFENLGDPDDEYFADGIADEILVKLTGVEGLRVLARTSTREYKQTEKTIQQIGQELGVDYILEGTIRWNKLPVGKSSISISPKLLNAHDGTNLWAEIYREDYEEIFAVQASIATGVAEAMGVQLLPEARHGFERVITDNNVAYDWYLRGLEWSAYWLDTVYAEKAVECFEAAVALDPDLVEAWGWICHLRAWLFNLGQGGEEFLRQAEAAGKRALSLDPKNVEALTGMGYFHYYGFREYERALTYFEQSIATAPGRVDAVFGKAFVLRRMGMFELSLVEFERSAELDPRSQIALSSLGDTAQFLRQFDKQMAAGRKQLDMRPDDGNSYEQLVEACVSTDGDTARAAVYLEEALERDPSYLRSFTGRMPMARGLHARVAAGKNNVRLWHPEPDDSPMDLAFVSLMKALVYGETGDFPSARERFSEVVDVVAPLVLAHPGIYHYYAMLAEAYSGLGRHDDAVDLCRRGLATAKIRNDVVANARLSAQLAASYAYAGRAEEALDLLESLLDRPSPMNVGKLKIDPAWDSLRDNPRFQRLVAGSS